MHIQHPQHTVPHFQARIRHQPAFGSAHRGMIDLYNNPDVYDRTLASNLRDDIPFYVAEATASRQPVLEVTAGTGRITLPMAQAGADVTGLDLSEAMLQKGREKAKAAGIPVMFVQADATRFQLNRQFGSILVPASGLLLLDDQTSVARFLDCAKTHLLPKGKLVLDVIPSTSPLLKLPADFTIKELEYSLPNGTPVEVILKDWHYDSRKQIFRYAMFHQNPGTGEALRKDTVTFRIYEPEQLRRMVQQHGFHIEQEYGDFAKTPFHAQALRQVLVCQAQQ